MLLQRAEGVGRRSPRRRQAMMRRRRSAVVAHLALFRVDSCFLEVILHGARGTHAVLLQIALVDAVRGIMPARLDQHKFGDIIDDGAKQALSNGKSLLAAGIKKVSGKFQKGDHIKVLDSHNSECARGLSSFSSASRLCFVSFSLLTYGSL